MDYDPTDRIPSARHATAAWIACVLVAMGALGLPIMRNDLMSAEAAMTAGPGTSTPTLLPVPQSRGCAGFPDCQEGAHRVGIISNLQPHSRQHRENPRG